MNVVFLVLAGLLLVAGGYIWWRFIRDGDFR